MEKGKIELTDAVLRLIGTVKVDPGSRCALLRRRYKKKLRDVAKAIDIHEHRLSEMERGVLRKVDPKYISYIEKLVAG